MTACQISANSITLRVFLHSCTSSSCRRIPVICFCLLAKIFLTGKYQEYEIDKTIQKHILSTSTDHYIIYYINKQLGVSTSVPNVLTMTFVC